MTPDSRGNTTRSPRHELLRFTSGHQRRICLASLFSVLNKVLDLAPPLLIGMAVNIVVERDESFLARWGISDTRDQLWVLALLTFLIWFLESVTEYALKLAWRNLAQTVQHELRLDAYRHVQGMDLAFFENARTGGLMSVLNDDVNQLERFLDGGVNALLQMATTIITISGIYLYLAPSVAWMAMVPMPFILWGSIAFQRRLAPRYSAVREEVGLLNAELSGNLSGIATIKSYTREEHEVQRIWERSNNYRLHNRDAIRFSSAFSPLIRMVIVLGFTATIVAGGMLAISGDLDTGSYAVMVFLTQRLLWPLTQLGETLDLYQRAMASTRRIFDLLATKPSIQDGGAHFDPSLARGHLCLQDVQFAYGSGPPLFRRLSLDMPAGQTTAIVGSTGSGKSTVIKLLLRFYDPLEGSVLLDGNDLRSLDLEDLRGSIALVSQDVFLFHGTVFENIAYGRPGASRADVEQAARMSESHDFILRLPQGYETLVGERGQKLSGGQRQRISIARALLKEAPVIIFDEATSSVDNETEAAIQRSLERAAVNRTTILIAHRLSTVRNAHRIYVLEEGSLAEQGTHAELIEQDGIYAALWRVQTGASRTTS